MSEDNKELTKEENKGFHLQVKVEDLKKNKLFVAVPMYGGICHGSFSRSMIDLGQLCLNYGIPLQIYFLFNESLIPRARNYCADEFMRSDATHMMFIDSDIGFQANDVIGLLAMSSSPDNTYDVLCAPYPKKTISWEKIKQAVDKGFADEDPNNLSKFVGDYVFNPAEGMSSFNVMQPVEVLEAGTGFMMIRRNTFEKYQAAYPSRWYKPDHVRTEAFDGTRMIMAYFDCPIDRGFNWDDALTVLTNIANKKKSIDELANDARSLAERMKKSSMRYLSEDYDFCQAARKAGLHVWICPWMKLEHTGSYVFGGSLVDIAALGASPTADVNLIKKARDKKK